MTIKTDSKQSEQILNNQMPVDKMKQPLDRKVCDCTGKIFEGIQNLAPRLDTVGNTVLYNEKEKKDLISSHSLLRQGAFLKICQDDLVSFDEDKLIKIAGNIFADSFIKNTDLEEIPHGLAAEFLSSFLKTIKDKGVIEDKDALEKCCTSLSEIKEAYSKCFSIREEAKERTGTDKGKIVDKVKIENAVKKINEYAEDVSEKIKALEIGSSFTISGGWIGAPSNNMLYEFTKNEKGNYDISVLNTEDAAAKYTEVLYVDANTLMRPMVTYKNVEAAKFISPDKPFFSDLLKIKVLPFAEGSPCDKIYNIFNDLQENKSISNQGLSGFISAQYSNSSGWKSLISLIFVKLGRKDYNDFKFTMESNLLVYFYKLFSEKIEKDDFDAADMRMILRHGAEKLMLTATKLAGGESEYLSGDDTINETYATALDILDKLEAIEQKITKERSVESEISSIGIDNRAQIAASKQAIKNILMSPEKAITQKGNGYAPICYDELKIGCQDIKNTVTRVKNKILSESGFTTRTQSRSPEVVLADITHLIEQLPIGDDNYINIPEADLVEVMSSLATIIEVYDWEVSQSRKKNQKINNIIFAGYAVTTSLARIYDDTESGTGLLKSYALAFPGIMSDYDRTSVNFDPKEAARHEEIRKYFSSLKDASDKDDKLFDLYNNKYITLEESEKGCDQKFYEQWLGRQNNKDECKQIIWDSKKCFRDPLNGYRDLKGYFKSIEESKPAHIYAAILHSDNAEDSGPLKSVGLDHISYLKRVAYLSHFRHSGEYYSDLPTNKLENLITVEGSLFGQKVQKNFHCSIDNFLTPQPLYPAGHKCKCALRYANEYSKKNLKGMSGEHPEDLLYSSEKERAEKGGDLTFLLSNGAFESMSHPKTESETMYDNRELSHHEMELCRMTCEPSLQPFQMISYFSSDDKIVKLLCPSQQSLFNILFFRQHIVQGQSVQKSQKLEEEVKRYYNDIGYNSEIVSYLADALKEKVFLKSCQKFIDKGINAFSDDHKPNIEFRLFFVNFSETIKRHLKHKIDLPFTGVEASTVQGWLDINGLSDKERSNIRLHLISFYIDKDLSSLKKDDISFILYSWAYHKSTPCDAANMLPWLEDKVEAYIHELVSRLFGKEVLQEDINSYCSSMLSAIMSREYNEQQWRKTDSDVVFETTIDGKKYLMNIMIGRVIVNGGEVSRLAGFRWEDDKVYKDLFGDSKFDYIKQGSYVYFNDSIRQAEMRVNIDDYEKDGEVFCFLRSLQCKINGEWCQYCDISDLKNAKIAHALIAGNNHWKSKNNILYITEKVTHKPKCIIEEGIIYVAVSGAEGNIKVKEPREIINYYDSINDKTKLSFSDFDDKEYVVLKTKSGNDGCDTIEFPRYKSLFGKDLAFHKTGDGYCWSGDKNFHVIEAKGLLGNLKHYIALSDGKKKKILVPRQKFERSKKLSPLGWLNVSRMFLKIFFDELIYTEEYENFTNYTYFEFDVDDRHMLSSSSIEGSLFLAYIFLQQGDYKLAMSYINKLDVSYNLYTLDGEKGIVKDNGLELLTFIINFVVEDLKKPVVRSATEASVALHAAIKILSHANKTGSINNKIINLYEKAVLCLYESYLKDLDAVPFHLRLSVDEELLLYRDDWSINTITDPFKRRYEFFKNSTTPSQYDNKSITHTTVEGIVASSLQMKKINIGLGGIDNTLKIELGDREINQSIYQELQGIAGNIFEKQKHEQKDINVDKIQENDEDFKTAVEKEFEVFEQELKTGHKQRINEESVILKKSCKLEDVVSQIATLGEEMDEKLLSLQSEIVNFANMRSSDLVERRNENLYIDSGLKKNLIMEDLILVFLRGDKSGFQSANKLFSDDNIVKLNNSIAHFLTLSTQRQQIGRALNNAKKLLECKDKGERSYISQELNRELVSTRNYDPEAHPAFLVFEYYSNITMRLKQVELIRKMLGMNEKGEMRGEMQDMVIQLIMGGGKTSVLAAVVGMYLAKKRKLSTFIVTSSLFESVKMNLSDTQRRCFNQELHSFSETRKDFSAERLKIMEASFRSAMERQHMILIKADTLQSFELEFLDCISRLSESNIDDQSRLELQEKIMTLRNILNIFREDSVAMIDEIDVVLSATREVNFPSGNEEGIPSQRINLVRDIYSVLASDKHNINGKSIKEIVGLCKNSQTLLSKEDYNAVIKVVAEHIADNNDLMLGKDEKLRGQFIKYVTGGDEGIDDLLERMQARSISDNEKDKESAHLIALVKHYFTFLLPSTLKREGNRNYGRTNKEGDIAGKVIPYLAVGTPATTQFGAHYEELAYHFQLMLNYGISEAQFKGFVDEHYELATVQAVRDRVAIDATEAGKLFYDTAKVKLSTIKEEGCFIDCLSKINNDLEAKFNIECYTASRSIRFHKQRLCSNSQSFVDQLGKIISFSGTPWNSDGYHQRLSGNVCYDDGSEGKIVSHILERKHNIHTLDNSDVKGGIVAPILEVIKEHEQRDRIRGIMDPGGIYKSKEGNKDIALQICNGLKTINSSIKGVLFFHQFAGESSSDTLALMEPDGNIKRIGRTQTNDKDSKNYNLGGLKLDEYFVFYDEKHTTGIDILQMPTSINLCTVDDSMLRRTLLQSVTRLRQFFFQQDVEFVIPKDVAKVFCNEAKEIKDVFATSVRNQAIQKAKELYRSYKQMFDNAIRQQGLQAMLESKDCGKLEEIYKKYSSFLMLSTEDSPYAMFGTVDKYINSIKALRDYSDKKFSLLQKVVSINEADRIAIRKNFDYILERAEKNKDLLQKNVLENTNSADNTIGYTVEVQAEVAVETEVKLEVEKEIEQELQKYEEWRDSQERKEDVWTPKTAGDFLKRLSVDEGFDKEDTIFSVHNLLKNKGVTYAKEYYKIFDEKKLFVTKNFAYPRNICMPVFNKLQRPGNQILVIKSDSGEYNTILVSDAEASFFKKFLGEQYSQGQHKNVWLMQPDGSLFIDNDNPLDLSKIDDDLFNINVFNGNIAYLDKKRNKSKKWMAAGDKEIKKAFLELKTVRDNIRWAMLKTSSILCPNKNNLADIEEIKKMLSIMNEDEIKKITDRDYIANFSEREIAWSITEQMKLFDEEQINLVPDENIDMIPNEKILLLNDHKKEFLSQEKRMLISNKKIAYIKDAEKINNKEQKISRAEVKNKSIKTSDKIKLWSSALLFGFLTIITLGILPLVIFNVKKGLYYNHLLSIKDHLFKKKV